MKKSRLLGAVCTCLFIASFHANAAVVTGNLYSVADGAGNLLGSTVDHWSFTVNSAGTVTIDTLSWEMDSAGVVTNDGISEPVDVNGDGESAFFDPYIYLFADDGALDAGDIITSNDDSNSTFGDGSIFEFDSYLSLNLAPGDYILAIGGFFLSTANAIDGFNDGNAYPATCSGVDVSGNCLFTQPNDHGDYQITFTGDLSITSAPAAVVPIPAAVWLFGSGLFGLVGIAKRQKHKQY